MATTPLWKNLKNLIEIDLEREKSLKQVATVEQQIKEDQEILPELEKSIDELQQASVDAKKNVDLQELNSKHLSEQEKNKRKALDLVKKQKEYEAIEKELKHIVQQLAEQDDVLVQAWHNLEAAQKKEADEVSKIKEKIELVKQDISSKKLSITEIQSKNQEIEDRRNKQMCLIPEDWLTKYERMRNKVADPLVPVINTSCSSCYYSIPPQDLTRLKRNAILPCRSCYRFLYYDLEEEKDLAEASY